jgi:hypothetical protein
MDAVPGPAPPFYWRAECHRCGRPHTVGADILRFLREGWPECCAHSLSFRVVFGAPPPTGGARA